MSSEFIKRILSSIVLLPLIFFIVIEGSFLFVIFLVICFFISVLEWNNMSKKLKYKNFGLIFLLISFLSIYNLRLNYNDNYIIFMYVIIICVSTDIGGYIFGKLFKGPKLTKISPNKTYSGAIGSFLFTFLILSIFIFIFKVKFSYNVAILAFFTSLSCQIGDLFFSFLKRKAQIKDTGNFLPGHGGILDRVDGMLFGVPAGFITLVLIY